MTAHDLGGADDIETAWRSRRYTAASMAPRTRLYGMSQKRSAAKMDGNTKRNTSSDEAFTARLRPPIHAVQRTIGRGLPRLGLGATSMRPVLRVTRPTPHNSTNARMRPACTTPRNARTETSRRGASCRWRSISERTVDYPMALATPRTLCCGIDGMSVPTPPCSECDHCVVDPKEPIDPLLTGIAGTRLDWHQVPADVRESIEQFLGRSVRTASSQAGGYSPALASRLTLDDGTGIFVKAIAPDEVSGALGGQGIYRREAQVAGALPNTVPAPRFLASLEADEWVVLIFEEVIGTPPILPWQRGELNRVLDAMATLASVLTPSPISAPPASFPGGVNGWASICLDSRALDELPGLDAWARANVERLSDVASTAKSAHQGPTLLHTDIRADNILLTSNGVVFVDWPHAKVGAPWVDLVYFLPSVAMQGGGDPQELFWDHPTARGADLRAVCSVLASLTGFFIYGATQEPPPGLPTLRKFQLAQGIAALAWLRQIMD